MKKKIRTKLKELGILIVYLFGSKATGMTTPLSDIDIGVVVKDSKTLEDAMLFTIYFRSFIQIKKLILCSCKSPRFHFNTVQLRKQKFCLKKIQELPQIMNPML